MWHPHHRDSTPLGALGPRARSGEDDFAADDGLAEHPDDGPDAFGLLLVAHELGDLPVPAGELDAFSIGDLRGHLLGKYLGLAITVHGVAGSQHRLPQVDLGKSRPPLEALLTGLRGPAEPPGVG